MTTLDQRSRPRWWIPLEHIHHHTSTGWAHPGMAWRDGLFYTTDPEVAVVVAFDPHGGKRRSFAADAHEIHGIAPAADGTFWLADPGEKERQQSDGSYRTTQRSGDGQALHVHADGTAIRRLGAPTLPVYSRRPFRPTSIALSGQDIWVADGYGADLVHRYDAEGNLVSTIGMGEVTLENPHSIHLDGRTSNQLLISDRGNARVLAVDTTTEQVREVIGEGVLQRPSGLATWQGYLIVADLNGRLSFFDERHRFLAHVGQIPPPGIERAGWPNALHQQVPVRPVLAPGTFNAPHDLAVAPTGLLAVSEWMIGGRLTLLELPEVLHALSL